MDYSKISFKGYIPSYKKYFDLIKEDKTINNTNKEWLIWNTLNILDQEYIVL